MPLHQQRAISIRKQRSFPGKGYTGMDFQIRAMNGDAVIRFVRLIKLTPAIGENVQKSIEQ